MKIFAYCIRGERCDIDASFLASRLLNHEELGGLPGKAVVVFEFEAPGWIVSVGHNPSVDSLPKAIERQAARPRVAPVWFVHSDALLPVLKSHSDLLGAMYQGQAKLVKVSLASRAINSVLFDLNA